ncbi:MAG: polyphosphate kinase 2 family protein [Anaerolineae bacterium]|nr:polyphosphate kinase 2 family protein [Anaerolineae bacterium]
MDLKPFFVKPGSKLKLEDFKTGGKEFFEEGKKQGLEDLKKNISEIDRLQEILYAEHKQRLLIIFQAMDTAGKDGVTRSVFEGVNPQGVKVVSFKAPTSTELEHDYLWRVHARVPAKGEIVVFNRSHYEDVLVVRVHELVEKKVWKRRYRHINEFERMLADEGVTLVKCFLHISPDTQKERLMDRINTPEKQWKFNPGDIEERKYWPDYMAAYEDMLNETSTDWAPWYVVPSDHNWIRNLVVSSIISKSLKDLNLQYPAPVENIEQYREKLI